MFESAPSFIRALPESVGYTLLNWGVNDMNYWPLDEATWKANYRLIMAWCRSMFPNAPMYISYPWRVGYDSQAATMHTWIDDLIAEDPTWRKPGPDEAICIKWDDNGLSGTDISVGAGVHYTNPVGVTRYAEAMQVALGF